MYLSRRRLRPDCWMGILRSTFIRRPRVTSGFPDRRKAVLSPASRFRKRPIDSQLSAVPSESRRSQGGLETTRVGLCRGLLRGGIC